MLIAPESVDVDAEPTKVKELPANSCILFLAVIEMARVDAAAPLDPTAAKDPATVPAFKRTLLFALRVIVPVLADAEEEPIRANALVALFPVH